ncbi:MAG: hypothetical protein PHY16_18495 [Methylobacter sp.]|nr:hypothetical protein [Methylobacter sp.]
MFDFLESKQTRLTKDLFFALQKNNLSEVKELLLRGASPLYKIKGKCATSNIVSIEALEILVQAGWNLSESEIVDNLLDTAILMERADIVNYILSNNWSFSKEAFIKRVDSYHLSKELYKLLIDRVFEEYTKNVPNNFFIDIDKTLYRCIKGGFNKGAKFIINNRPDFPAAYFSLACQEPALVETISLMLDKNPALVT